MNTLPRAKGLLVALALLAGAGVSAAEITVFAAASLTDALTEIAAGYEEQSGDHIIFNFAGSGTLARQIEAGAPADIFFSADEAKADGLEAGGLLVRGTRKSLLGNTLVIIAAPDSKTLAAPTDLTNAAIARVALGDVKAVPAGTYARAYLDGLGCWKPVEAKAVPCESVRAVLGAVESGNVDAGIVYKTDAAISRKVKIVFEVPLADGPKISYPIARVEDAPQPDAAKRFMAYLNSAAAKESFEKFGFIVASREDEK